MRASGAAILSDRVEGERSQSAEPQGIELCRHNHPQIPPFANFLEYSPLVMLAVSRPGPTVVAMAINRA